LLAQTTGVHRCKSKPAHSGSSFFLAGRCCLGCQHCGSGRRIRRVAGPFGAVAAVVIEALVIGLSFLQRVMARRRLTRR